MKLRPGMLYTKEYYNELLHEQNQYVTLIGDYINTKTKTTFYCAKCGYEWEATPASVLIAKYKCPECRKTERMYIHHLITDEEFSFRLFIVNPTVEALEKFQGLDVPIKCRCKICGHEWKATPSHLIGYHPTKCPICSVKKLGLRSRKTTEEFIEEMRLINPSIKIIGEYINGKTKIRCLCLECGEEFEATPNNLLKHRGCPVCNSNNKSKGERRIYHFLNKYNIDYITQFTFEDCKDQRLLPFDFYLNSRNILIEYDGEQHYEPRDFGRGKQLQDVVENIFKKIQYHDAIKTKYCEDNNIRLIRIPYWDFNNIEEILTKELGLEKN